MHEQIHEKKKQEQQKEVEKIFDTPISPFPVSSGLFQPSRHIINHKSPNRTKPESESNEWVSLSRDLARELVSIHLVYWHKRTLYPPPPPSPPVISKVSMRIILQPWHTHVCSIRCSNGRGGSGTFASCTFAPSQFAYQTSFNGMPGKGRMGSNISR